MIFPFYKLSFSRVCFITDDYDLVTTDATIVSKIIIFKKIYIIAKIGGHCEDHVLLL